MIVIQTNNFGMAHKRILQSLIEDGNKLPTDYDTPDELPSLDLPMTIEILKPWDPPVFSQCVWSDAKGMFDYANEIIYGTSSHVGFNYTYHGRFGNQLKGVIDELNRNPYSRRAQFTTWLPNKDLGAEFPPCFQRGWLRLCNDKLDLHCHYRSRDALKAWGSNVFAFAHLHKWFCEMLDLPVGVFREFVDSMHIYGRDIKIAKAAVRRPPEKLLWPLHEMTTETLPHFNELIAVK